MKQNGIKGIRVGSSDHDARLAALKANHESEELKELISRGYQVQSAKRRPRIKTVKTPKQVVVSLGEVMTATITLSWEDYQKHGTGLKIVMRIY